MKFSVELLLFAIIFAFVDCDSDSDVAQLRQKIVGLKGLNETQLQQRILSNFNFSEPAVKNRVIAAKNLGLNVYSNLTAENLGFWTQALKDLEKEVSGETDASKRLSLLFNMAATSEGMVWDETDRINNPNITTSDVVVTDSVLVLEAKLNANQVKLTGILGFASVKELTIQDYFWSDLYLRLSGFYIRIYNAANMKAMSLSEPQKSRELTAINRDIERLIYVMTTSGKAASA